MSRYFFRCGALVRGPAVLLAALLLGGCQGPAAESGASANTGAAPAAAPPFVAENGQPVGSPGQVQPAPLAGEVSSSSPAGISGETATTAGAPVPDSLHLVSPGQAGPLRIGLRETELRARIPASRLRALTGGKASAQERELELLDATQPATAPPTRLLLAPDSAGNRALRQMLIRDPQYRTAEGIGVGSPFGAARQNLGFTQLRDTPFGLAAVSGAVRLGWLIDPKSLPPGATQRLAPAAVPPAARITGIVLY